MKYFKLSFSIIFILNLFAIFIFPSQFVYAETYTCKNGDICSGTYDSAQSPTPPFTNYCKDACPSGYQCTKFDSTIGCVDQTRSVPDSNMPTLQIPDLNVKFSAKVCEPNSTTGQTVCKISWIGEYVAAIYKYAIGIVGILAAVVLMIGGVIWIVAGGSATMIGEAKAWIAASLTGLVIALTSYLILYQVNPALTVFGPLGIAQVKKAETPISVMRLCKWEAFCQSGWEISDEKLCAEKLTASETVCCCVKPIAACQPVTTGSCSVANLAVFGNKAEQASAICQGESNGTPGIGSSVDICADGNVASWGLFQINITAHSIGGYNCPSAFSGGAYTASNQSCKVIDTNLYNNCVNAAKDPNINIQKAYEISSWGYNWNPWGFYTKMCKSYF